MVFSYNVKEDKKCEIRVRAKMTRLPFPKTKRNSNLLKIIHADICELNSIKTKGDNRYFIIFIDDCSRFVHVYLMKNMDESYIMFKSYKLLVENQLGRKIKILRNDKGSEYFFTEFSIFCA